MYKTQYRTMLAFVLILTLTILAACSSESNEIIIIQNGVVFTATGEEPISDGVVVIENEKIIAVGPESEIQLPSGAKEVDAQGGFIMPGLIDARASTLLNEIDIQEGQINEIQVTLFFTRTIEAGITTLRAVGWDLKTRPDLSELNDALAMHGNNIPTLIIAGSITHAEGNVFEIYPEDSMGVFNIEEAQQAAEDIIQSGADQIAFLQPIPPDRRSIDNPLVGLSFEQQTAIVEAGHEQGLKVIAQTSFPEDALDAINAGVNELIGWPHGSEDPLSDELIQALVENSVPVLTGFSVGVIRPYEGDVRRLIDAGGVIVFGTFAPNSGSLANPVNEMKLMAQVGGMTPSEILTSATANAAEAIGLGDVVGSLETGKTADIVIIQGNPLEDINDITNIYMVLKAGEVVFQADIQE